MTGIPAAPPLGVGDPVPNFFGICAGNPRFRFDSVAGRYVLLAVLGSLSQPAAHAAMAAIRGRLPLFDDERASCFVVTMDVQDFAVQRAADHIPGLRHFEDRDGAISRLLGSVEEQRGGEVRYTMRLLLLDPGLRVLAASAPTDAAALVEFLSRLPPPGEHAGPPLWAPVLLVPRVFEPELCQALIQAFRADGGEESGFMRERDGRTVLIKDANFKRRQDFLLPDGPLKDAARGRIRRRVVPEIAKAFQFSVTRMERDLVARYGAGEGFFKAHRDNTTKGTAHRRFACSINLAAESHDGGDLVFPEFGPRTYRPPTGGAVVFGCGLLHEVRPVTAGERFAFLPFLYDDAAAEIRRQNAQYLEGSAGGSA
jgi:predicted 2-oxoglutarate/Fe(II)-dependent dioxygenase YbiX